MKAYALKKKGGGDITFSKAILYFVRPGGSKI